MTLIKDNSGLNGKLVEMAELEAEIKAAELKAKEGLAKSITNSIDDLSEQLQGFVKALNDFQKPEYFDKDLNKNLIASAGKIISLLENIKQPEIDLSPIKAVISEIKNQNSSLINLVQNLAKESNKSGYESLVKEVMDMVRRSNDFIAKGSKQVDNTGELKGITAAIQNKKPVAYEFTVTEWEKIGNFNHIKRMIGTPIQNTDTDKT